MLGSLGSAGTGVPRLVLGFGSRRDIGTYSASAGLSSCGGSLGSQPRLIHACAASAGQWKVLPVSGCTSQIRSSTAHHPSGMNRQVTDVVNEWVIVTRPVAGSACLGEM